MGTHNRRLEPMIRPIAKTNDTKTGFGKMKSDDPRLLTIANAAKAKGMKPAAEALGISSTLVLRAMKIHGVKGRPLGWHLRKEYA